MHRRDFFRRLLAGVPASVGAAELLELLNDQQFVANAFCAIGDNPTLTIPGPVMVRKVILNPVKTGDQQVDFLIFIKRGEQTTYVADIHHRPLTRLYPDCLFCWWPLEPIPVKQDEQLLVCSLGCAGVLYMELG